MSSTVLNLHTKLSETHLRLNYVCSILHDIAVSGSIKSRKESFLLEVPRDFSQTITLWQISGKRASNYLVSSVGIVNKRWAQRGRPTRSHFHAFVVFGQVYHVVQKDWQLNNTAHILINSHRKCRRVSPSSSSFSFFKCYSTWQSLKKLWCGSGNWAHFPILNRL